jgi:agmatine/peptidylarginine deiminase
MMLFMVGLLPGHAVLPTDTDAYTHRFTETDPPAGQVRPVAEFEPASHVLIRYPLGIPVSLVTQLSNTAQVVCIVSSASVQNQATTSFNNGGVNMANVSFMIAATDSYWTRDYGPWFIFDHNNDLAVVDFQYNRPRPNDNMIPQLFAQQNDLTYYGMNLQQTGGNYMADGVNSAAQTNLVYSENSSIGQTGVNTKMQQYLGITNYFVRPDPNNTYIDHIDCWAKFLAPDKILVRSVPTSHAQYNSIEQAAAFFAGQNCAWGYPYKVYRVNTPQNQPYTNSLILNKKVFVPIMNSTHDAAALQVYRNALPGYEVIGVTGTSGAPWESTDALHCRTHEIPDAGMLHIKHMPLWGVLPESNRFEINTIITPHSGQPVYPDSVYVAHKVNSGPWQFTLLTETGTNSYSASLNGFAPGDTIRYYIHAADQSGRSNNHPLTAGYDPHLFVIQPDIEVPVISHTPPVDHFDQHSGPATFVATVVDNVEVEQVLFRFRTDSIPEMAIPMDSAGSDSWSFTYYPEFNATDSNLYYQIVAFDNANPANQAVYPSQDEWQSIPFGIVANADENLPASDLVITGLYPNPFRTGNASSVSLRFKASEPGDVTVKVYNVKGQLVHRQYVHNQLPGEKIVEWNGKDLSGRGVASGLYFLRLEQGPNTLFRKLIVCD